MTASERQGSAHWGVAPSPRYEALAGRFRPLFAQIREGAIERERNRDLPYPAFAALRDAKFGALRVPEA